MTPQLELFEYIKSLTGLKFTAMLPKGSGYAAQIAPGKEGLVHISKLDDHRVEHVEDVVAVGDPIFVMVTDIDQQGRINLSRKDALAAIAKKRAEAAAQQ